MRSVIRQIGNYITIIILNLAALSGPARMPVVYGFQSAEATAAIISAVADRRVPPSVTDTNFIMWQPDQPVPIYPSYARQDIGWTDGYVIYYNPYVASQVSAKVFAFFLAHEYGHIYQKTGNEIAADQFGGRVYARTDMSVVYAAIWHMANIQPYSGDWTHPIGLRRAYIIGEAAGLSRSQIETVIRGQF